MDSALNLTVNAGNWSQNVNLMLLLTLLTLAPAILMTVSPFARILISLSFLKSALGVQTAPPAQILVGLSLFLAIFVTMPTYQTIYRESVQPLMAGTITEAQAIERAVPTTKAFLLKYVREKDLSLFVSKSGEGDVAHPDDLPLSVIVPAYITSELTTAFEYGFIVYLFFLAIDMIVAATLMSLGMMMVPPVMVSLPLKLLVFLVAGGWEFVVQGILSGFGT